MKLLSQDKLNKDIDVLVNNIRLNTMALETLDLICAKRIQAKINQLQGVMYYHKEQKRKRLLEQINNDRQAINKIIDDLIKC